MFTPKYREVCRELRAPQEKIEEVIQMTENLTPKKHRNPLKIAGVLAAALALTVVSVSAAAPETATRVLNWVTATITGSVQINEYETLFTMEDETGRTMTATSLHMPSARVENRDGRAILVVEGEDEVDITDALANDGAYHYEKAAEEGITVLADVEGSIDHWTIQVRVDSADSSSPVDYTVLFSSEDAEDLLPDGFEQSFPPAEDGKIVVREEIARP